MSALRWRTGALVALVALPVCVLLAWAFVPKPALYGDIPFSTLVTDREGRPLKLVPADDGRYRLFTELDDIAPVAQEATLLYEDRGFYRHPGVNPLALARAVWTTYVRRTRVVGGSTITMQLARLRFDLDTRSVFGKLVQSARALQLERHYDKAEILEAYLNLAPYGGSIEGIGTASRIYFDKPASALSLGEALALAVIPQNPTGPVSGAGGRSCGTAGGARAVARGVGVRRGRCRSRDDRSGAARTGVPVTGGFAVACAALRPGPCSIRRAFPHPHDAGSRPAGPGRGAHRRARGAAPPGRHRERGRHAGRCASDGGAGAGRVRGVLRRGHRRPGERCGGRPVRRDRRSSRCSTRWRWTAGLIHPMTLLEDAPRRYAAYTPENFDRGFLGPVFARDALVYSRNVAGGGTARGLRRGPVPGLAAGCGRDGPATGLGLWPGAGPRRQRAHHGGANPALCGARRRRRLARLYGGARFRPRHAATSVERGSQLSS